MPPPHLRHSLDPDGTAWLREEGKGKACTLRRRRWLTYVFTKDRNFTRLFLIC